MRSGLLTEIKNNPKALALVILFHLILIVLLSVNLASDEKPPMPSSQKHKIIDAVAVDASKYDERKKQKKLAEQKKIAARKAEEKKRQELARKKVQQKKRLAEKKKQQAAEKKKAIALAKKKDTERKAKEKKIREKKLKEQKAKEKKAREKQVREKKAREKKERELKEKLRQEAEEKRQLEEERKRRAEDDAEFKRSIIEEERRVAEDKARAAHEAQLQTMRQRYIMLIAQKVENNWLRPASTSDEQSCEVIVTQTMTGDVIDVMLQACTDDIAFQRSVERAVRKASPLPLPPDPELFEREIYFKFKPR